MSISTIKIGDGFDYRAIQDAGLLLRLIACTAPEGYNDRISLDRLEIEFNQNTGDVYAVDEDGNVFMVNGKGCLEQYYELEGTDIGGFYEDLMKMYNEGKINDKYLSKFDDIVRFRQDRDAAQFAALLIDVESNYEDEVECLYKGFIHDERKLKALQAIAEKFGHEDTVARCNRALEGIKAKSSKESAYER